MARAIHKLTDRTIGESALRNSNKTNSRISDGGGLYLRVTPATGGKLARSWSFMWTPAGGKRREIGLGPYPDVSLSSAREIAAEYRALVASGGDPEAERKKDAEPTFAECADTVIEAMERAWRNAKHRHQWRQTLGDDYCRAIRPKKVSAISLDDVLSILKPIWLEKPETASRLRGRIERVLNFAKVKGFRTGENPAVWRGNLDTLLPKQGKRATVKHHAAMPYRDVPAFMARLEEREAVASSALRFLILTAARTGEVIGATWQEIDMKEAVWTIPASRMKARKEHRVPLSPQAMAVLRPLHEARISDFVFPGLKPKAGMSNLAMVQLMKRMKANDYTVHGFRSSFRDWVGDETSFPREIAEAALAHQIGSAVEQSYRRGDAFAKRQRLMEAWSDYCDGNQGAKVIALNA